MKSAISAANAEISAAETYCDAVDSAYVAAQQRLIQIAINADPTSEIVSYLTSMLQAELNAEQEKIAALGAYQIASMMEGLSIYDQNDPRYLAMQEELAWLTDMVAIRNDYYQLLSAATLNYNTTVYNAMGSYNASTLAAQATYQMTQIQNAADYGRQVRSAQYSYSRAEATRSNTLQIALINAAFDEWGAVADYEADLAISRLSSFLDQLDAIESDDNLTPSGLGDAYDNLSSAFSGSGPGSTDFAAQQAALRQSTENAANAASSAAAASNAAAFRQSTTSADADYLSKSYLASAAYTAALAPLYSSYLAAIDAAELAYSQELCRLEGLFQDALNTGVNNLAEGTGSIDVQVCFVAGTPIRLKNGEVVKIEDLKKGLFSRAAMHDDPTGEIDDFEIIELYENETDHLVEITFENVETGNRFSTKSTPEHPFFVYEKGWTAAKDIQADDECRNAAKNRIKVVSVLHLEEHCKVYNFQVKSAHTYFVGETDEESILVHNACVDPLHKKILADIYIVARPINGDGLDNSSEYKRNLGMHGYIAELERHENGYLAIRTWSWHPDDWSKMKATLNMKKNWNGIKVDPRIWYQDPRDINPIRKAKDDIKDGKTKYISNRLINVHYIASYEYCPICETSKMAQSIEGYIKENGTGYESGIDIDANGKGKGGNISRPPVNPKNPYHVYSTNCFWWSIEIIDKTDGIDLPKKALSQIQGYNHGYGTKK